MILIILCLGGCNPVENDSQNEEQKRVQKSVQHEETTRVLRGNITE